MSSIAPCELACGWELGVVDELSWHVTGTGYYTASIDSAVKRTGSYSLKLDGDSGLQTDVYLWEYLQQANQGCLSAHLSLRIATAPTTGPQGILEIGNRASDSNNPAYYVRGSWLVNTNQTLRLGGPGINGSQVLELNTWYNVVMRYSLVYIVGGANATWLSELRIYDDGSPPSLLETLVGAQEFIGVGVTVINAVHIGAGQEGVYNVDDLYVVRGGLWAPAGAAVPDITVPNSTGATNQWTGTPEATNKHLNCDEAPSASPDSAYIYHGGDASFTRQQQLGHATPTIPGGANELAAGVRQYVRRADAGAAPNYFARVSGTGLEGTTHSGLTITPDNSFGWRGRAFRRATGAVSAVSSIAARSPGSVGNNVEVEQSSYMLAYGPDTTYDFPVQQRRNLQVM